MLRLHRYVVAVAMVALLSGCGRHETTETKSTLVSDPAAAGATYVGSAKCRTCHEAEFKDWKGSHHERAMMAATDSTVLGDFNDASFESHGVTTRFFRRDGKFMVNTDGPDGKLHDYPVAYTFGVDPLQQYLIPFPGGRYQCLDIAWDTRPRADGGQRWFHLHPDEAIRSNDELHWTQPGLNWNYMCAECHSTHLEKNYSDSTRTYATTWSEISVGCEACHGAGSAHVEWAEASQKGKAPRRFQAMGLQVRLGDLSGGSWAPAPGKSTATHTPAWRADAQIETCARCHSRRTTVSDTYVNGKPFMDTHLPVLLDEGIYYPDGQILEEDYEYQSFKQSKMYEQGVACSNCHNPHSGKLRAAGDAVCAQCHSPAVFATPAHHFHKPGSAGASCVACHMPQHTYMVVHRRHDHSMRVPRPDLSEQLGAPNACTACHTDRSAAWAADSARAWWPDLATRTQFGTVIENGRVGGPEAATELLSLVANHDAPAITRATAVSLLASYPSIRMQDAIHAAAADPDPLIRLGAARAANGIPVGHRYDAVGALVQDSILTVRGTAARSLVAEMPSSAPDVRRKIAKALQDYIAMQETNADRAFAHLNLGLMYAGLNQPVKAESEYRTAIDMEPRFVPAYVNLADLYRTLGRDAEGKTVLEKAIEVYPDAAELHRALGLLYVRQHDTREGLAELKRAHELRPDDTGLTYYYGVALYDSGKQMEALTLLKRALDKTPYDRRVLQALATYYYRRGDLDTALVFAKRLKAVAPDDDNVAALVYQIGGGLPVGE